MNGARGPIVVRGLPAARTVRPVDRSELETLLGDTSDAIVPVGGGTRLGLGGFLDAPEFIAVDLTGLDRVIHHAVDDLTITVEPGLTLSRLDEILAAHGQWLPLDPPFSDQATVGGLVATAAWGPLRPLGDTPRRHLIGIAVMDGSGKVHRAGGRVVKNVAGYDLMKLHAGALGSLGIIVEMSFRVLPRPEVEVMWVGRADDPAAVAGLAQRLNRSDVEPAVFMACDSGTAAELHGDRQLTASIGVVIGFLGFREEVAWREEALQKLAAGTGVVFEQRVEGFRAARLRRGLHFNPGPGEVEIRAHGLPSRTFDLLHEMAGGAGALRGRLPAASGPPASADPLLWFMAYPSLGVVRVVYPAGGAPEPEALLAARDAVEAHGGWLVIETCPDALARPVDVWGLIESGFDLMAALKKTLDPARRINPGRLAGGL